ncbi:hypothetical protein [Methylobacterium gregans]|uniref:MxaH protein n=1 Tax=Methylobacterium gregans TaxID=374424 RepID=A0AA37MBC5_9HYPH|nr:hypothetical protein [Methylobacterium gregans]MDQ0519607.1 hypothetical protein [Methylobacterium gregans]GJD79695.1 hypothetical protein NBEOAGPD_2924 [Methylobacterium gregans]GLS52749.1 hypothetical protein GCM10007886_09320 [Methylobacterium gregans]
MRVPRALAVLGTAFALLAGCGEEDQREREPETVAARSERAAPETAWLAPTDTTEPALWLARRATSGPSVDPAALGALRASLAQARGRFVEDPRMVANRTAQLEAMLAEIDVAESPAALIADLSEVAAVSGRRQLYGEMCQHYATVRRDGLSRAAALERLRERYAAQRHP